MPCLGIEAWRFFGFWKLGFEILIALLRDFAARDLSFRADARNLAIEGAGYADYDV